MKFVNVYEVTRHYGGPEEGGWWYDWAECLEVYPVRDEEQGEQVKEWLWENYKHKKYGDISSVLGGVDIRIYIEDEPKEYESTERPYYE
jgi:hypothetical protein